MVGLPTLAVVTLWRKPRFLRAIYALVFFVFAFVIINLFSYSYYDLFKTFMQGTSDPYLWNWWDNLFLYFIEMPSLVSLPILVLALLGSFGLLRKYARMEKGTRFWSITLIVLLPNLLHTYFVLFQLDHFLRHVIPYIPWMAIAAGWYLVAIGDKLKTRKLSPALIYVPVFLYLALFVFDGERAFIQEPRNRAALWLMENLPPGGSYSWREHDGIPGYNNIYYPYDGNPDVAIIDLHHANHYLSGMGLKNSFPRDHRYIFEGRSQEVIDQLQGLFKGTTEYREVARYKEGYFMPEYIFVDQLIGNRSRNYVAEVVVFSK